MGLLFETHEGLIAKLEPTWRDHGLSGLEMNALQRLSRSPGRRLRMVDLATQTGLSTSGVTRLVDRLQRNGLVVRETDPADRRNTYATLTQEGDARLGQALPEYRAAVQHWFIEQLPPDQLDSLLAALRILRDALRPEATAIT
ncbi:MarR family transcriptional regulator [Nocardia stercoris]|uniref:MarR family transcriptional regulator n=2 Tax=Nocardia stercoris TaxID=2483361 RepID=A0A3M2L508_9NOCA|nr:MarR family transcriptional regulator [Nocardia stercoris]